MAYRPVVGSGGPAGRNPGGAHATAGGAGAGIAGMPSASGHLMTSTIGYPFMTQPAYAAMTMPALIMPGQIQVIPSMYQTVVPSSDASGGLKFMYTAPISSPFTATPQQTGQGPADQKKWSEDQQRLREKHTKERNYQLQQQRLRQFQPAGSQSVDADRLIQNMFGRMDVTKKANKEPTNVGIKTLAHQPSSVGTDSSQLTTYPKSRDWTNMRDLQDVFETSESEFPPWCQEGACVPKLYAQIEAFVTRNGVIDTTLLHPILLSSGLSRETLGHIWFLANRQTLGQLTKSELYAILAMVALAQTCVGPPMNGLDRVPANGPPLVRTVTSEQTGDDDFDDFQSATTAPTFQSSRTPEHAVEPSIGGISSDANCDTSAARVPEEDSDFADFQQASRVEDLAQNATPQRALPDTIPAAVAQRQPTEQSNPPRTDEILPRPSNLNNLRTCRTRDGDFIGDEDRYSAFRELVCASEEKLAEGHEDEFGDFLSSSGTPDIANVAVATPSPKVVFEVDSSNAVFGAYPSKGEDLGDSAEDEFEFMSYVSRKPDSSSSSATFSAEINPVAVDSTGDEDDFGEFVASGTDSRTTKEKTEAALDGLALHFNFMKPKDLASSDEQRSVTSLDFGTFDTYQGVGDDLSRCGSVPSLNLKVSSDDDPGSKESTPSNVPATYNLGNGFTEETKEVQVPWNGGVPPLAESPDRYSVIRSEDPAREADSNECKWQRCLDRCYEVIRNALNIFNGISSSSVCQEVINTEEGENYLRNIMEVYCISQRIAASAQKSDETSQVEATLRDIQMEWNNLSSFIAGSHIFPSEDSFHFASSVLDPGVRDLSKACGVCLLNVASPSSSSSSTESHTLTYGGRCYHASCANFWLNCVDSLLPALTFARNNCLDGENVRNTVNRQQNRC